MLVIDEGAKRGPRINSGVQTSETQTLTLRFAWVRRFVRRFSLASAVGPVFASEDDGASRSNPCRNIKS